MHVRQLRSEVAPIRQKRGMSNHDNVAVQWITRARPGEPTSRSGKAVHNN